MGLSKRMRTEKMALETDRATGGSQGGKPMWTEWAVGLENKVKADCIWRLFAKRISLENLPVSVKKIGSRIVWLYRKCIKTDLTVEQRCMADLCPLLDRSDDSFQCFSKGNDHLLDSMLRISELILLIFWNIWKKKTKNKQQNKTKTLAWRWIDP